MDIKQKIEKANEEAASRLNLGDPVLVDIAPAGADKEMVDLLDNLL
jgi:hypothetical protein